MSRFGPLTPRRWLSWGLLASVLAAAPVRAQTPEPTLNPEERVAVDGKRQAVENRARQTVTAVLGRLCPGRCELLKIEAEVDPPEVVGQVAPGFEPIGARSGLVVEATRLNVTVLLDRKLPGDFRANMPRLLEARLGQLAPVVRVRAETLSFPEPQLEPMPPIPPELTQPSPMPLTAPPEPEPLPEPVPEPELWEEAARAMIPWLGPIILAILLSIVAGGLLRRKDRPAATHGDAQLGDAPAAEQAAAAEIEALRQQLEASRAMRNRVLRQWLQDDVETVARAVQLLGPEMFSDLRREPALSPLFEQLSTKVATQTAKLSAQETQALTTILRARVTAAKMVMDDDLAGDWGFIEGLGLGQLNQLAEACTPPEHVFLLARLPESLRSGYLRGLDDEARQALVVAADDAILSRQAAQELGLRLRRLAQDMVAVTDEHGTQVALLGSMLHSLDADRQVRTLNQIRQERPQVVDQLLDRCVLEAAIPWLPDVVMADACHQSSVMDLAAFCNQTTDPVRQRLFSILTPSLAASVRDEMAVPQLGANGKVRDEILSRLFEALTRDGLEAGPINRQPLEASAGGESEPRRDDR